MLIKNVNIFTEDRKFRRGSLLIKNKVIQDILWDEQSYCLDQEEILDGRGRYAIPGMIDMHFHGCMGADFCDGTLEAYETIANYELSIGVTSICPATMTLPLEELEKILKVAANYAKKQKAGNGNLLVGEEILPGASLVGINMEGPFISKEKCGAQAPMYIQKGDPALVKQFREWSQELVKIIGIAPETMSTEELSDFLKAISNELVVTIAHSNASYEQAMQAFLLGASHVTHLYNGMSPFTAREPGIVGATWDAKDVTAEIICDGIHVHPAAVRACFQLLGAEHMILISDSMRGTGLEDGTYTLGGQDVMVTGNKAYLVGSGALAGSVTTLPECFRIAVQEMKIPLEQAILAVTRNPAKRLGIEKERGTLAKGFLADIVLLDEELKVCQVIKEGELV